MKVIVLSQSKGGAGKSTTALVIAQVLSHKGNKVCVLDADPNLTLLNWKNEKSPIQVIGDITEGNLVKNLNSLKDLYDYVIIDLEGTASLLTSRAILKADFVLIPLQASLPDASQANRIIQLIKDDEAIFERPVPHAFIFTRTNSAIKTKLETSIKEEIERADYPLFTSQLNERSAYKAIFYHQCSLYDLPESVSGQEKAIQNAEQVCNELLGRMS